MTDKKTILHGTAVVIPGEGRHEDAAVFLRGLSGSGKSDLAFRLLALGAGLIADDQAVFEKRQERIFAFPAEPIRGLLELRGVGLLHQPVAAPAPLALIVDLVPREDVPRLPERETVALLGATVPRLKLYAFDASTPLKIKKAVEIVYRPSLLIE